MIRLTTRGHYSVKALLDLALQPGYGPASVAAIAKRQQLPAPYLEKLLMALRKADIVKSIRGVQGGYQLKQHPSDISLGHILEAVGEAIEPLSNQEPNEHHAGDWVTFALWNKLHQKMKDALFSISLEDLYYDARSRQAAQGETTSFIV